MKCDICQSTFGRYCSEVVCGGFYCFTCLKTLECCPECDSVIQKKLLIFDIDGTLISSNSTPLKIIPRPDFKQALDFTQAQGYDIAIWTAATEWWANCVVTRLFGRMETELVFVWSRNRCTQHTTNFEGLQNRITLKKLKKVRQSFPQYGRNIWIVDDTPSTYQQNYGHAIPISTYRGTNAGGTNADETSLLNVLQKSLTDIYD